MLKDLVDHSKIEAAQLRILLDAPHKFDLSCDNIAEITRLVTSLLEHEALQNTLMEAGLMKFMTFFLNTYSTRIPDAKWQSMRHMDESEKSRDENEIMQSCRTALTRTLASVALRFEDVAKARDCLPTMERWLLSPEPAIQTCAYIFLGNLAYKRSQLGCELVSDHDIGGCLYTCLVSVTNHHVLITALDLLRNLATTKENRRSLGNSNILQALALCWSNPALDGEIRQRAFFATRQLMSGYLSNVYRMISPRRIGAHIVPERETTMLQLALFFRSEQRPDLQAEVGRIVAEAWRTINKDPHSQAILRYKDSRPANMSEAEFSYSASSDQCDPKAIVRAIHETLLNPNIPQFTESLLVLTRHNNESAVTEGWLALALMAMWEEGSLAICKRLYTDDPSDARSLGVLLKDIVRSGGPHKGGTNNARYLLAQLRQQFVSPRSPYKLLWINLCRGVPKSLAQCLRSSHHPLQPHRKPRVSHCDI